LADLDAVVVGTGPGPFTGLRVGMVTAAAIGDAVDVPVYGVCSLDAIAVVAAAPWFGGRTGEGLLVVTDARRREVDWAAYDRGGRRARLPRRAGGRPAGRLRRDVVGARPAEHGGRDPHHRGAPGGPGPGDRARPAAPAAGRCRPGGRRGVPRGAHRQPGRAEA